MCPLLLLLTVPMAVSALHASRKNDTATHHEFTALLDGLLQGYDNKLRPNFGGLPVAVEIDINVRSMGPISEFDMSFSIDCYFRQTWIDKRLELKGPFPTMTLGQSTLSRIWIPDTYFLNGKQSHLHTLTVPNRLIRIDQNGRIFYSQRLTIKASCPMDLRNFPMDTQKCHLQMGSFGYTTKDALYSWNLMRQVTIANDMKMSQFDLVSTPFSNLTIHAKNSGEHSVLVVTFYLRRHTGYFLLQVYAPCILLVVLSWVAFWINREATSDRITLGVTTILTMTFLGLDSRNDLPKVSYSTALDLFIVISFSFVMATILQFALVHYFTKRGSGEVSHQIKVENEVVCLNETEHWNSVSRVDSMARVVFPLFFLLVNLAYWYIYLSRGTEYPINSW
ncbi:hypothetical protein CHUAL_001603 [Chamberlinius hualienensis]